MLKALTQNHIGIIKRNPVLTLVILLVFAFVMYMFNRDGHRLHGAGYLVAMLVCMYITDLWMMIMPSKTAEPLVKNPKKELLIFLLFTCLGLAWLVLRFMVLKNWNNLPGMVRIALIPGILFVFPVCLGIYFLAKKYSLKELGLRFDKSILLALPIAAITGLTTWWVAPENIHWKEMLQSEGILNFLVEGFISAALSEEFMRYIGQTRLKLAFNSSAWAIFITVSIWALMHSPKWYNDGNGDIIGALEGSVRIIPLGDPSHQKHYAFSTGTCYQLMGFAEWLIGKM